MGATDARSPQLRKSRWKGKEGREPTGNVTGAHRTHCHRQLSTLPKHCGNVAAHTTVSAKEP